jgi:hypothetical protein
MRFLFALLAVLSGLCAIGQPVAARVGVSQASAARSIECPVAAESVADQAIGSAPPDTAPDLREANAAKRTIAFTVLPRTVRIRCDRALE